MYHQHIGAGYLPYSLYYSSLDYIDYFRKVVSFSPFVSDLHAMVSASILLSNVLTSHTTIRPSRPADETLVTLSLLPAYTDNCTIALVWVVVDFTSFEPVARLSRLRNLSIALMVSSSSPFCAGSSNLATKEGVLLASCANTMGTKS